MPLLETSLAVQAGPAQAAVVSQRVSQAAVGVLAEPATAFIVDFGPARAIPPSAVFGPDVSSTVISPAVLAVVVAHSTEHVSVRKATDVVLVPLREVELVSPEEHFVFAPETSHRVIFRPPS